MSRGVAIEMWDEERKFLQQMGRKCGQHLLALMLISGIDSQLSGVSLGWGWLLPGLCSVLSKHVGPEGLWLL